MAKDTACVVAARPGCCGAAPMSEPLQLQHLTPLAHGAVRLVFAHPQEPGMLVKVMRPELIKKRYGAGAAWFRKGRRYDPYLQFLREIREYVAAYASHGGSLPIAQKVCGLIETDLGLGLVTEAVRGADGELAPTLARVIEVGGFDAGAQAALERFLTELLAAEVVVGDLHERNVVYAAGEGGGQWVMIDGLGSANLVPLKSWSRALNRRSKERRIARLRGRIARRLAAFAAGRPDR